MCLFVTQVLINVGILAAYCSGIPYELIQGFKGFDVLGGVWCSWWRLMLGAGLLPAAFQVGRADFAASHIAGSTRHSSWVGWGTAGNKSVAWSSGLLPVPDTL